MSKNRIIVACAGAGKTTALVQEASRQVSGRVAIVTYTNNNASEIRHRFAQAHSCVPSHVHIMTWYEFLLRECARPYQHALYKEARLRSMYFVNSQSTRHIAEANTGRHYCANGELLYSDKAAKFAVRCDDATGGLVVARLSACYSTLLIDEWQDLESWDLDLVARLLGGDIRVWLMGDPRQSVLSTHLAQRNKKYRRCGVMALVEAWESQGLCGVETMNGSHRCGDEICAFVNRMWPGMEPMESLASYEEEHQGVFLVATSEVDAYMRRFQPKVLRHQRRKVAPEYERNGMNFGVAKGREWDRVLIVPTGPIAQCLRTGEFDGFKNREKLHVAMTRARVSVAFVYDGESPIVAKRWQVG